jgi:hypothetical protein
VDYPEAVVRQEAEEEEAYGENGTRSDENVSFLCAS